MSDADLIRDVLSFSSPTYKEKRDAIHALDRIVTKLERLIELEQELHNKTRETQADE